MPRLGSRLLALTAAVAFAAAVHAAATPAAARASSSEPTRTRSSGATRSRRPPSRARSACSSIRITLQWKPGESQVPACYQLALKRLVLDSYGIRVVVSVYGLAAGRAANAGRPHPVLLVRRRPAARQPRDRRRRDLERPERRDVLGAPVRHRTARASRRPTTRRCSPTCYDAGARRPQERERDRGRRLQELRHAGRLHARVAPARRLVLQARSRLQVRAAGRSRSSTRLATSRIPASSAERPWTKHPGLLRDLARRLLDADGRAGDRLPRHGAARPRPGLDADLVPGAGLPDAAGSRPDRVHRKRRPTRARCRPGRRRRRPTGRGPRRRPAVQLEDAIRVAYCQPAVGAYFNFHLYDERDLAGWQSGVFWPDGQPKAAYQALRRRQAKSTHGRSTAPRSRRRRPAAAGRGEDARAAVAPDQRPARDLGRGLRRDGRLAHARSRPACRSRTGSSISACRRCGRRRASGADG